MIQASQSQTMQRAGREDVRFNLFLAVVYLPESQRHKDSFMLAAKTILIGQNFPGSRRGLVNHLHGIS